ncbi:hypothetical protein BDY19DRAFT_170787 [Irpex rosettiformis]|uniref:Uncharacterized protein n=1 Tax=Irpex rosettiformis TaxID=378272 RepID=A0ACB8U3K0_9APHY|nr:hypothetical protein BDY19DRAFT_170787 [Irpex rosettiformis]
MSSSAASDSSSRPDNKRAFDYSPSASPIPKKSRPDDSDNQQWSSPDPRQSDLNAQDSPRVQLPSIASFPDDRRASLPSALVSDRQPLRLPHPTLNRSSPSLSSYTFPEQGDSDKRPRLAANTELGIYSDYSVPNTSSSYFPSPLSGGQAPPPSSANTDDWVSPSSNTLVRPSPTPELQYDDSLRRASLPSLYGGVTRISGQTSDRTSRNGLGIPSIKAESDWSFPGAASNNTPEFNMSPPASTVAVSPSQRSPQQQTQPNPASLVDRPPRKRGKLPKPVTDFLKDWLHRHSDHPYPSEEEKKQLCHATGLSMSQVSNWMINARRRILAPAQRAVQGPTSNGPYATSLGGHPRPIMDAGRRASMPTDSLALYHPMSLQSLPDYATGPSTRHLVGMTRSMSSGHATVGSLSATAGHHPHHHHHPYAGIDSYGSHARPSLYASNQSQSALHPSSHTASGGGGSGGGYLGVPPMSAPASMSSPNPFTSGYSGGGGNGGYGRVSPDGHGATTTTSHTTSQARYSYVNEHSVSPGPGSGYNTPH